MDWLSLIFGSPLCAGCGRSSSWLCAKCWQNICWYDHRVADPVWTYPSLRRVRAATEYCSPVSTLIHHIKYDFWWQYSAVAAELIDHRLGHWVKLRKVDLLIPVPLHRQRMTWRGFNQAELIARRLSKCWNIPTTSLLERKSFHQHQASLNKVQRQAVQHEFRVKSPYCTWRNQRILLVDDVFTTGATLSGCARALEKIAPAWIGGICVARA